MGIRIFGFIFSAVVAFATSLIGNAIARFFLEVVARKLGSMAPLYNMLATIGVILIFAIVGFFLGSRLFRNMAEVAKSLKRIPAEDKIASTFGTLISLIPVVLLWAVVLTLVSTDKFPMSALIAILMLASIFIIWLGNVIALSMKDEMKFLMPGRAGAAAAAAPQAPGATPKLLDTNIIIDGRVYDICRAGFLEGSLILPGFVLEELHHIADSADALRRNRGRRGLDILHQLQTEMEGSLRIVDRYKITFAPGDAVDIKLVKLAKAMGADIVTNDYNLNKVAKLHGVRVLNINELANAVKPVVLPGEELVVTIVREGKEYNQGVGYLDDGTMVVVENGKKMLGDTVTVAVSSVLQTVAGKMIFADLRYEGQEETDDGSGSYSGRGGRRKTT